MSRTSEKLETFCYGGPLTNLEHDETPCLLFLDQEWLATIGSGQIRAVVDRTLPLAEARKAHELMEDRAQFVKLVLMP